jgi:hypothetical protein
MLLGNLMYRRGKYLHALSLYNSAVTLLLERPQSTRIFADESMAFFNRALIELRLGDDENGLKDLEAAVTADSTQLLQREVLALVKRRMGKFNTAIADTLANKVLRTEKKRGDLIETVMSLKPEKRVPLYDGGASKSVLEKASAHEMSRALPFLNSDSIIPRSRGRGGCAGGVATRNVDAGGGSLLGDGTSVEGSLHQSSIASQKV